MGLIRGMYGVSLTGLETRRGHDDQGGNGGRLIGTTYEECLKAINKC